MSARAFVSWLNDMKHYHAENAGRGKIAGASFEIYSVMAGSAFGVFQAEDQKQIEELDNLVRNPRSGVTLISESEYEDAIKKKSGMSDWDNYPALRPVSRPQQVTPMPLKGEVAGRVVENPDPVEEEPPLEIKEQFESSKDVLELGKAEFLPLQGPAPKPTHDFDR